MCTFVKKNIYIPTGKGDITNTENVHVNISYRNLDRERMKYLQKVRFYTPSTPPPQPVLEMYNIIEQLKNIIITTSLPSNQTDIVLTSTFISQKSYAKKEMRILFEFLNEHRQVLTA